MENASKEKIGRFYSEGVMKNIGFRIVLNTQITYTEGGNKMKLKKRLALALATCMIVTSLSACGGKEAPSESGMETPSESREKLKEKQLTTISEAFAQKSIWFRTGEEPAKDTTIDSVFAFDGKGDVIVYTVGGVPSDNNPDTVYEPLCFGDLRDLSDKEILELAKGKNKAWFEGTKQRVIKDLDAELLACENDEQTNLARNKWEQLEYEQVTYPQPYTLEIKTDGTGNQTAEETLHYNSSPATILDSGYMDITPREWATEIKLHSTNGSYVVYDMTFMGCGELYQIRDEGEFGWGLDTPGTEGIKVD